MPEGGPLIIVSNHFSWYEAPLISLHLPYKVRYMMASQLLEYRLFHYFMWVAQLIPIARGQADRKALRMADEALKQGDVLGIMPEAGINEGVRDQIIAGDEVAQLKFEQTFRQNPQLMRPRPGSAYLAVRSQAPILPVAFVGTEQIMPNLRRWRRTAVAMHIGPTIPPFKLDPSLRGPAKREQLDAFGDTMMQHIAALLPPRYRGPYRNTSS